MFAVVLHEKRGEESSIWEFSCHDLGEAQALLQKFIEVFREYGANPERVEGEVWEVRGRVGVVRLGVKFVANVNGKEV